MRWGERARSNRRNESVRAADKGWLQHGFEDSVNSRAEKRLLVTKVLELEFCVHAKSGYAALHMHTPKGARRVGGCGGDRKSDDDNTVGGWMVVHGVASACVLTYPLRERGNQSDR